MRPRRNTASIARVVVTALVAACTSDAASGPVDPPTSAARPVLAISSNPRTTPSPQIADFVAAIDSSIATGARGNLLTYTWSDLEPDSARLSAQKVLDDVRYSRGRGLQVFLGIQVINTVKRELPSDIATLAWTDARLQRRFERLLDAIAPILGDVTYFSIGNEVGGYLRSNSQWGPYTTFLQAEVASLHRRVPGIKVGATLEYEAAASQTTFTKALIAVSDVAIYTHYPFRLDSFNVEVPTITRTTFDNMILLASGKPVILQELGYPSSPLNGSSEAQQAAFFTDAIAQWRLKGAAAMPFVSLFLLHDIPQAQCDALSTYYNLPNQPTFVAFLCSLGLRRVDGTPRPAWNAVRDATAWLRAP